MHHVQKRDTGPCQEVQDLYVNENTGLRGICVEKRDTLKGFRSKSNVPNIIVIEDDDGDSEVQNCNNKTSFRWSHHHLSSCSGLGDSKSSSTFQLSTSSSDEEDCVVMEPHVSIPALFVKHRFPQSGKRLRPSADIKCQFRRRCSPSDISECEIVPNFDGKVKQDWEEAALRRRREKSRRAESEESTSASVHANSDAWKRSKGNDGNTLRSHIKNTRVEALRTDPSSYSKKRKEDIALDQQGSNVNGCDRSSEAGAEQTSLPETKLMGRRQDSKANSNSLQLVGSQAGGKASGKLNDTESCLKLGNYVKANYAYAAVDKVLTDREALKHTEEFRHADEEEWARRHLELQKQAANAQREKKKRKMEADRRIEMEARQKHRLEEIRQSQLKEEQATGYKEQVRDSVQSELNDIANTCRDMATLLRRLGVPVEGGVFATGQQVTAAYKKALLCFHPDRAALLAKSDPATQVKAEEKFKLVSRMKSVLPLVSSGFYQ